METHESDILKLIEQGQQAFDDAIVLLVRRYKQDVYHHCYDLLRDAPKAQKMTEQTFLKVRNVLVDYEAGTKLYTWLLKIATEVYDAQTPTAPLKEWLAADELDDALVNELSEQDRLVLRTRNRVSSWEDAAYILGILIPTARKRGERALRRLRELKYARERAGNNG